MDLSIKKLTELVAFNRRNFIKLLIGGAAGIHVTPLPWKLMDDVAIWTQNWPWVPVPPRGAFAHAETICTLCPGGCGISVRKVDERPVKIEGRADYPVNPGGICPLGSGGLQLLYTESLRFTGPMKRVGPRGADGFVQISWDEALEIMADRLVALKKQGNSEAASSRGWKQAALIHVPSHPKISRRPGQPHLCQDAFTRRYLRHGQPAHVRRGYTHGL
jgi:anaerobic selenocysteine-containing dehydrogenase